MFGYILPDKPNMYVKDYTLYRAYYCGLCKSTKKYYGNLMRFSVNYDVTFLDIIIHGLKGVKAEILEGVCALNPVQKKPFVKKDDISAAMVHLNVLLADFKSRDDMADAPSGKKRLVKRFLKRKTIKARQALPEEARILDETYIKQQEFERQNIASMDRAADAFSVAMRQIFKAQLREKYSDSVGVIAYNLAKFVYLMDAIDDFEQDCARGEYNALRLMYKDIVTKRELIDTANITLDEMVNGILADIREAYEQVEITINEGIVTNTLWFGLRARAQSIMNKECTKCQKVRF
ncbi:MAG: hypothetical protein EOM87_03790 [Clostridia bacterium]|nr:hypothetical protein [Clostridia bacterium]